MGILLSVDAALDNEPSGMMALCEQGRLVKFMAAKIGRLSIIGIPIWILCDGGGGGDGDRGSSGYGIVGLDGRSVYHDSFM